MEPHRERTPGFECCGLYGLLHNTSSRDHTLWRSTGLGLPTARRHMYMYFDLQSVEPNCSLQDMTHLSCRTLALAPADPTEVQPFCREFSAAIHRRWVGKAPHHHMAVHVAAPVPRCSASGLWASFMPESGSVTYRSHRREENTMSGAFSI